MLNTQIERLECMQSLCIKALDKRDKNRSQPHTQTYLVRTMDKWALTRLSI